MPIAASAADLTAAGWTLCPVLASPFDVDTDSTILDLAANRSWNPSDQRFGGSLIGNVSDDWIPYRPMSRQIATSRRDPAYVGNLIRHLRKKAGLRQVELADMLGEYQPFVSKIENGDRALRVVDLPDLCAALGLRPSQFVAMLFERRKR